MKAAFQFLFLLIFFGSLQTAQAQVPHQDCIYFASSIPDFNNLYLSRGADVNGYPAYYATVQDGLNIYNYRIYVDPSVRWTIRRSLLTNVLSEYGTYYPVTSLPENQNWDSQVGGTYNVQIAAAPIPTAFNVTGGGCTNSAISLDGSETGVTYQLWLNGAIQPFVTVAGTGSAVSFPAQSNSGSYTVTATYDAGGCAATMNGSVSIIPSDITATTQHGSPKACGAPAFVYLKDVSAYTPLFNADFTSSPAGFSYTGNAVYDSGGLGTIWLTFAENSQSGTAVFTPTGARPEGVEVSFQYTMSKNLNNNSEQVADGFSFNYGTINTGLTDYENGMTSNGLVIRFLEYQTQRVEIWFNGNQIGSTLYKNLLGLDNDVTVSISETGEGSLFLRPFGLARDREVISFDLGSAWAAANKSDWKFGWGARTGGFNNQHKLNSVQIYNTNGVRFSKDNWATSSHSSVFQPTAYLAFMQMGSQGCSTSKGVFFSPLPTLGASAPSIVNDCPNRTITYPLPSFGTAVELEARFASRPNLANVNNLGDAVFTEGSVELTPAANDKNGRIIFPTTPNMPRFTATFRARVWDGGGADGFAFNYGAIDNPSGADGGMFNTGTPGLSICFATYQQEKLRVKYKNEVLAEIDVSGIRNSNWVSYEVSVSLDYKLTVKIGATTYVTDLDLGALSTYATDNHSNWQFGFGARTGGANDRHQLDDVIVFGSSNNLYSYDGGATYTHLRTFTTQATGALNTKLKYDGGCYVLDNNFPAATSVPTTWYYDGDADNYGDPLISQLACTQPSGYVANNGDCDDDNNAVFNCVNWTGAVSNDWSTPDNWANGVVPDQNTNVVVRSPYSNSPAVSNTASSPAICKDLTVAINSNFYISLNAALTVTGNLINNGFFQIKGNTVQLASLITLGTVSGTGSFQTVQTLAGSNNAGVPNGLFYYVGTSIGGTTAANFWVTSGNKLWQANESTQSYTQITDETTPIVVGKGYVVRMANETTVAPYTTEITSGDFTISGLTRTGTTALNRGYNLVSNPYPSSVSWDDAIKSNLSSSIWYRTHNVGNTMLYDTYNAVGQIGTNNNQTGAVSGLIRPNQGFWVRVEGDGNTGQLQFTNQMRSHQSFYGFYKLAAEEGVVRMTLSNDTVSDEAIILFNTEAQDSRDDFDSDKFWAGASVPQVYTTLGSDSLVINGLSSIATNPVVELGVKIPAQGNYSLHATNSVAEGVWLEDRLLNIFQDLNVEPNYSFTSPSGNIGNRFALHFGMSVTGVSEAEMNSHVYTSNGNQLNIILAANAQNGIVEILDMTGRIVHSSSINANRTILGTNVNAGVYLIRVETAKGTDTHRVLLN
ncbi:MAG: T9SS type A sorting domain-containing protein [Flavobacteriales bacterium]|nr:T9SS type A sorting domain-containing protein [Flavobacteriales bacterium]